MSVDAASKHFINRDFSLAVAELGPLPFAPQAKPWILFFALCDRAFSEPDRPAWPLNGSERKTLRAAIVKGTFWQSIVQAWGSDLPSVPVAVITAAMGVAAKHGADPVPAVQFAEAFLADVDDEQSARSVATAFIVNILVELQHDYFYARQLVEGDLFNTDADQQGRILTLIAEHESQFTQRQREEAELLAQQERERVAAAIAETKRKADSAITQASVPEPAASASPAPLEDNNSRWAKVTRPQRSLPQVWQAWFRQFIRSQGFYNALALFFLMCSLASSAGLRRQATRFRAWLWAVIMQTLRMGLTVTYL